MNRIRAVSLYMWDWQATSLVRPGSSLPEKRRTVIYKSIEVIHQEMPKTYQPHTVKGKGRASPIMCVDSGGHNTNRWSHKLALNVLTCQYFNTCDF